MPDVANYPKWWICGKCYAQVAVLAVVYTPFPSGALPYRRGVFEGKPGELWKTALLVNEVGLAMNEPNYCPNCGAKAVSRWPRSTS